MNSITCPLCRRSMSTWLLSWCWRCDRCGLQRSTLEPDIAMVHTPSLDEEERREALVAVRHANDRRVLALLAELAKGRDLLDVGSAYGWFLGGAARAGFTAHGIEPDSYVASEALRAGHDVRVGLFPDALSRGERFDVVTFNDVLEHIPDALGALASARDALRPSGIVSVNIPLLDGPVYRAAQMFQRAGWTAPFERMWQAGFPSPHLWYFSRTTLLDAASRVGLSPVAFQWLPSVTRAGIVSRVRYGTAGHLTVAAASALAVTAVPLLERLRPSDIGVMIARRS